MVLAVMELLIERNTWLSEGLRWKLGAKGGWNLDKVEHGIMECINVYVMWRYRFFVRA